MLDSFKCILNCIRWQLCIMTYAEYFACGELMFKLNGNLTPEQEKFYEELRAGAHRSVEALAQFSADVFVEGKKPFNSAIRGQFPIIDSVVEVNRKLKYWGVFDGYIAARNKKLEASKRSWLYNVAIYIRDWLFA